MCVCIYIYISITPYIIPFTAHMDFTMTAHQTKEWNKKLEKAEESLKLRSARVPLLFLCLYIYLVLCRGLEGGTSSKPLGSEV